MNGRHAICLVIDGLRASALGCYGNTVSRTPYFDDLASRSAIVEWLWADGPSWSDFYRAAWEGIHALRSQPHAPQLIELLQQNGVPLRLVTENPQLAENFAGAQVATVPLGPPQTADEISATSFAQFCATTIEHLDQWQDDGAGSVTWIHSRGLMGPWDAPSELRAELLDEDDPNPLDALEPPGKIDSSEDPDEQLLYRTAYHAQISAIDACLGPFCRTLDEVMADRETLLMVTGSRGFALGEHGGIGSECPELFSQRLHLPWLLHVCDEHLPGPRISGLAQPADIYATLLDWLGIETPSRCDGRSILPHVEDGSPCSRDMAVAASDSGERAIATPAWMMRQVPDQSPQLFAKPDDRWEHNDVAVRCPEEVDKLTALLQDFEQAARDGAPLPTSISEEDLLRSAR